VAHQVRLLSGGGSKEAAGRIGEREAHAGLVLPGPVSLQC
jgi:hypothetical protein